MKNSTITANYVQVVAENGWQGETVEPRVITAKNLHALIEGEAKQKSRPFESFESLLAQTFVDVAVLYSKAEEGTLKRSLGRSFRTLTQELAEACQQNPGITDNIHARPVLAVLKTLENVYDTPVSGVSISRDCPIHSPISRCKTVSDPAILEA